MLKRKLAVLLAVVVVMGITIPAVAMSLLNPPDFNFPVSTSSSHTYLSQRSDRLWHGGDSDIFTVTLRGGRRYKITLSGPSGTDFDLYLYDENGHRVASSTGNGSSETVYITPAWTGRFYIKVLSYRGSGSFTVRLYRRY